MKKCKCFPLIKDTCFFTDSDGTRCKCECHMKTTPQEEWKSELEKLQVFRKLHPNDLIEVWRELIDFIENLIKSEKEKSRQEVLREVREKIDNLSDSVIFNHNDYIKLTDVKNLLSTLESKE